MHSKLKDRFQIQGFPSLKFFGKGQKSDSTEEDYNGGRSLSEMMEWVLEKVNPSPPQEGEKDVVILTDSNFEETVMKSEDIWFIEFYAPWCGHCKQLQPEWNKLALRMKEHNIKIGKLDSTQHRETSTKFNISGYTVPFRLKI